MRRVAVEDLGDAADAALLPQVAQQWLDANSQLASRLRREAVDVDDRVGVGAEQPGPDRPLMVDAVAVERITGVVSVVAIFTRCQRTRPDCSEQPVLDDSQDRLTHLATKGTIRQTEREQLIRPEARIADAVRSDDVVEIAVLRAPEALHPRPGTLREVAIHPAILREMV